MDHSIAEIDPSSADYESFKLNQMMSTTTKKSSLTVVNIISLSKNDTHLNQSHYNLLNESSKSSSYSIFFLGLNLLFNFGIF